MYTGNKKGREEILDLFWVLMNPVLLKIYSFKANARA
jgi:hypothetical protein